MSTLPPDTAISPISYHESADFDNLLDIAREHLRELAGEIWTDHNTHDPGITILEVLCFAIADLSYRTSFDIKDLMAAYPGDKQLPIDLPLADVALPNHPFTVQDLRKVLLDLAHPDEKEKLLLRNAWPLISETSEKDLYVVEPSRIVGHLSFNSGTPPKTSTDNSAQNVSLSDTRSDEDQEVKMVMDKRYIETPNPTTRSTADDVKREVVRDLPTKQAPVEYTKVPTTKGSYTAAVNVGGSNQNVNPSQIPPETLPGGGIPTVPDHTRLIYNGLYGIQLEFEEDRTRSEYWLADLNRNSFEATVTAPGQSHRLSVLLPYWDQIEWSLRDVDLSQTVISFEVLPDTNRPYFIAVDKLNYDDHFYDYYAEVIVDQQVLGAYLNIVDPVRSSISDGVQSYPFQARWLDWNELANGMKMDYSTVSYTLQGIAFVGIDASDPIYDIRVNFKSNLPDNKEYPLLLRIEFDAGQVLPDHFTVISALQLKFGSLYQARIDLENEIRTELLSNQSDIYAHYLSKLKAVFRLVYGPEGVWEYLGDYRNLCEDFSAFSASRVQEIALFGKVLVDPGYNSNQVLGEVFYLIDQFLNPLVQFKTLGEMSGRGYSFSEIFNGPLLSHGFIEDGDLEILNRRSVIYTSDLISIIMDVEGVVAVEGFSISSYIDNRLMGRKVTNCLSLTYSDVYRPRLSVDKSALEVWSDKSQEPIDDTYILEWYRHLLDELKAMQLPEGVAYELGPIGIGLPAGRNRQTGRYKSIQHDFPLIYGIGSYGLPADADDNRQARARQLKAFLLPFEQFLANYLKQIAHLPELFSFNQSVDTTYQQTPLYEVPEVADLFRPFLQSGDTWDNFKADLNNAYRTILTENESREEWLNRRNRFLDHLLGRFSESFSRYAMQQFNRHKHMLDQPDLIQMQNYQVARQSEMERLIDDKIAFATDLPQVTSQRNRAFNYNITDQGNGAWGSGNISGYKRRLCRLLGIRTVKHEFLFNQPDPQDPTLFIDREGMHVVEHILLRPRRSPASVFPLENQYIDGQYVLYDADRDPYSFCLTVVLPSNAGRFKEAAFRQFAEMLIREETPAHIRLDFKWMTGNCGQKFEESLSEWIWQTHAYSPWVFQSQDTSEPNFGSDLPALNNLLKAQDALVNALQMNCSLRLTAFDKDQQPLKVIQDVVRFNEGEKDIYFLQVSEPGGKLTVMYRKTGLAPWEDAGIVEPVKETWLRSEEVHGKEDIGLSLGLFGEGQYMIIYSLGDESRRLNVEVLPAREKVRLNLIRNEEYLLTQPKTPFSIPVKEVRSYLIQASPLLGALQVSAAGGPFQTVPFASFRKNVWRVSDFYREYGPVPLIIRYELQDRSAQLEIHFVEEVLYPLAIRVSDLRDPEIALEALEKGRIALLPGQNKVRLDFTPRGGTMRIFRGTETSGELLVTRPESEWFEMDVRDYVTSVDDNLLLVEYTYQNQVISVVLEYLVRQDPEVPQLILNANMKPVKELPAFIDPSNEEIVWNFTFRPVGGTIQFYRFSEDKRELIHEEPVTVENQDQKLEVWDIWKKFGNGRYEAVYVTAGGTGSVEFILEMKEEPVSTSKKPLVILSIPDKKELVESKGIYHLTYDFKRPDHHYIIKFRAPKAKLIVLDGERKVLELDSAETFALRSTDMPHGECRAEFYPEEGEPMELNLMVYNLDPRFKLTTVSQTDENHFEVNPLPVNTSARTYIWRLDEKYVSRSKKPTLKLDFTGKEAIEIQLTVFADGENELFEMMVTPGQLREMSDEK